MVKVVACILAVFLACVGGITCSPADRPPPVSDYIGFPELAPIANADPSIRHPKKFQVPTRLLIERTDEKMSVTVDMDSLEPLELDVGANMVTGFKQQLFVYRDNKLVGHRVGLTGGTRAYMGTDYFNRSMEKIPQPGEKYLVEVRFEIFETDIPAQHMWSPEASNKYKVLWTRTLRQYLPH